MTPDGLPIIGYPESAKNFLHAVGMCGQGFMMGPGLGKILAESIASGRSPYGDIFEELGVSRSFDHIELLK